ncbi:MAG: DUF3783 domain-containing protein [Lachnospiraceae bacterium]|nr:DUF3783 domain-containing protein [Lachnospiraceae bacterium]
MEQILAFGLTEDEYAKLEGLFFPLRIRTKKIPAVFYSRNLRELVSMSAQDLASPKAEDLKRSMAYGKITGKLLLFCELSDARLDQVLDVLRPSSLTVDYKAILTPTNKDWNVALLMAEMAREKAALV